MVLGFGMDVRVSGARPGSAEASLDEDFGMGDLVT